MELKKGLKFVSKWFAGLCIIDLIDEEINDLEVLITPEAGHTRTEHWNLQHTIWGFENEDYSKCCDKCTDLRGQNIGNMYVCPHCGRLVS